MISFKRLTRGVKLLREHFYDPVNEAIDRLTKSGVPIESYDKENGTFRLTFYFPTIRSSDSGGGNTTVPFVLPPLQDEFALKDHLIESYQLTEVSVGQDTRCEPAAIAGPQGAAAEPTEGNIIQTETPAFDLFIKEHLIDSTSFEPFRTETFSLSVPSVMLSSELVRSNPFVQSGLAVHFDHKKSYLIQVAPKNKTAPPASIGYGFTSLCITLKFKTKLRLRDQGTSAQNLTPFAGGNFVPQTTPVPAGDSPILADGASGVNTGLKVLDSILRNKLAGGFTKAGVNSFSENLKYDSGYDVIAVPMFGGWGTVYGGVPVGGITSGGVSWQNAASMPFASPGAGNFKTMDRALVSLQHPISIHHVILAVNYSSSLTQEQIRPVTVGPGSNLTHEVGIGLYGGIRSDNVSVNQVAHVSWTPATIGNYLIDRGDYQHNDSTGRHKGYAWDLIQCPLVVGPNGAGAGYVSQGKPVFAAQGTSQTASRSFPITLGDEQALDIRWKISDAVDDVAAWPASPKQTFVGYRGHWVYLICKKFLR